MRHFGLIGRNLGHSWSANYFSRKFTEEGIDADYRLVELTDVADVRSLDLDGYNVTIPYKTTIIPYLREIDSVAKEIGAVNVVKDGKGWNTDWIGVTATLTEYRQKALILGQGGAAKAVKYALERLGVAAEMVSARGHVEADLSRYRLIVNATPLGMWPEVESLPDIDYNALGSEHILFDCVYNPEETAFMRRGKAAGATVIGGKRMLEIQAEESWKIWNN
ncbi:MAG: shikimate dehydrogenase [Paludibacteraceae bacterium]|nr:shikimate dehydrogenase [Paludibacteraceae bacterium]